MSTITELTKRIIALETELAKLKSKKKKKVIKQKEYPLTPYESYQLSSCHSSSSRVGHC